MILLEVSIALSCLQSFAGDTMQSERLSFMKNLVRASWLKFGRHQVSGEISRRIGLISRNCVTLMHLLLGLCNNGILLEIFRYVHPDKT
jgi:hypothetical protein